MCSQCEGHPDQEKFVREFNARRLAECLECGHLLSLHGKHGCSFERGDSDETGCALGPCGCSAEQIEEEPHSSFPSPLLAKHKLDVSWDEL